MKKQPYKVLVSETFQKEVIIYAEDVDVAHDIAENLCNDGIIDITSNDTFAERNVVVQNAYPNDNDLKELQNFIPC